MEKSLSVNLATRSKMPLSQVNLLKVINSTIENKASVDWGIMVKWYTRSVHQYHSTYGWHEKEGKKILGMYQVDIDHEYEINSWIWTYEIKNKVKSLFIQSIGSLVIKNKLLVIPIIEIE